MASVAEVGSRLHLRGLFKRLGPGFITGAADDDPSGIATYSQAGAQFGFGLLWTVVLTWPLMVAVQSVSARIGRVTGHGLAGNMVRSLSAAGGLRPGRRCCWRPTPSTSAPTSRPWARRPSWSSGGPAHVYTFVLAVALAARCRVRAVPSLCRRAEVADLLAVRLCRRGVHRPYRLARGRRRRGAAALRARTARPSP